MLLLLFALAASADGDALLVRAIRFEGNHAASSRTLRKQVWTAARPWWKPWKQRHPLSPETVEGDVERLERFYKTLGYFDASVTREIRSEPGSDLATVVFSIDEGEPVLLTERSIDIPASIGGFPPEHWTHGLPLRIGKVFSLQRYEESETELRARLSEAGHPLAKVEGGADVYLPDHAAHLTWRVDPGPVVRFGPVRIRGLGKADEALVRPEVTIEPGSVYSLSVLRKTREQIQALRVFGSITVRPRPEQATTNPAGEPVWPVDVDITERPLRSLRLGVGYGTDEGPRVQAGWVHRNLFGGARHLETSLRYSSLERSFRADLTQPNWLARAQTLDVGAGLGKATTPAYDAEQLVGRFGIARPLGPESGPWTGRVGWELSYSRIGNTRDEDARFLSHPRRNVFLSGPRFGVRRSTVDDVLDPSRGTWLDLTVASVLRPFGSQESFVRAVVEGRAYRRIGRTVLAGRLQLGTIEPFGGTSADSVPLTERFYLGGGATVRGFEYWRLGPHNADGDPVGGTSSVLGSVELRFPIRSPFGGVVFVDAGELDLRPHRFVPADLTFSTGVGLRLKTPLGPIRLDLAVPLNAPDGARRRIYSFSVGQAF